MFVVPQVRPLNPLVMVTFSMIQAIRGGIGDKIITDSSATLLNDNLSNFDFCLIPSDLRHFEKEVTIQSIYLRFKSRS